MHYLFYVTLYHSRRNSLTHYMISLSGEDTEQNRHLASEDAKRDAGEEWTVRNCQGVCATPDEVFVEA